ncbi:glycosyltransferase [Candidatus Hepatincola sp. Pdp]
MKIALIFPYNNPFTYNHPKPVVLSALSYIQNTRYTLTIITPDAPNIFKHSKHTVINIAANSKGQYLNKVISTLDNSYDIVEVHQDTKLAAGIAKFYPQIKVTLIKHSFLLIRSKERFLLFRWFYYHFYLKHIYRVFGISKYVCNVFEKKYPKYYSFNVLYNSYGHVPINDFKDKVVQKKKQIVFSGKPVGNKGVKELFESLLILLNKYPNYNALIMGAFFSKKSKYRKTFNKLLQKPEIQKLLQEKRILIKENLSIKEVFANLLESEIALILTKINEAFGLSCLEYHLASCAVVSSGKGGLKEVSGDYAMFLQQVTSQEIVEQVSYLIENPAFAKELARKGNEYVLNAFNPVTLSQFLDAEREKTYELYNEN